MASGTENLIIEKGEDYSKIWYLKDSSRNTIDLTGYTARMQVRETYSSTSTVLDLTTENGGIVITALEGKIELVVANATTSAITANKGVYDLELIDASSKVSKLVRGTVRFPDEVTR